MPRIPHVSAFTRKLKDGKYWYAQWHVNGKRVVRATGLARKQGKDGGRKEAEEIGRSIRDEEALKKVALPTMKEYAKDFYTQSSAYLKRQRDKGRPLNSEWAKSLQSMLDRYVLPRWGGKRLDEFNSVDVENWLADLPLSGQTRCHLVYGCLRVPLREAARQGIIRANPLEHVEPPVKDTKKRDIFTVDELRLLFPADWKELVAVWGQPRYAALFMVMATTGIREGEARALQWKHVLPNGWLTVERAVKEDGTIGALKKRERTGEPRVVALPIRTQNVLEQWHGLTPFKRADALVFFGDAADHVLNRRTFGDVFNRALEGEHHKDETKPVRIKRGDRNLSVYSLRHQFNTMMRRSIPADALLALMGHRDSRMSDHYDHPEIADRIRALEAVRPQIEGAIQW